MLIYVNCSLVKLKIEVKFGIVAPLYCVVDTDTGFYNSPLWFEMYRPDEKVIDNYLQL